MSFESQKNCSSFQKTISPCNFIEQVSAKFVEARICDMQSAEINAFRAIRVDVYPFFSYMIKERKSSYNAL